MNKRIIFSLEPCLQSAGGARSLYDEAKKRGLEVQWGSNNYEKEENCIFVVSTMPIKNRIQDCVMLQHGIGNEMFSRESVKYLCNFVVGKKALIEITYFYNYVNADKDTKYLEAIDKYRLVGYPKLDKLFNINKEEVKKSLLAKLKMPYEKTILFFPSVIHTLCLQDAGSVIKEVVDIFKNKDVNLIVKPYSCEYPLKKAYIKIKKYMNDIPNTRFICNEEIKDLYGEEGIEDCSLLYLLGDVLIGSTSASCITEFTVLDKPTIQLSWSSMKFVKDFFCKFQEIPIGLVAYNLDELEGLVFRSIKFPDEFTEARKVWAKYIVHDLGNATKKCVDILEELIKR